jgi:hypothetical protein
MRVTVREVSNRVRDWAWCFWNLLQSGGCEDARIVRLEEDPCERSEGTRRVR